jgi:hypothetical protein
MIFRFYGIGNFHVTRQKSVISKPIVHSLENVLWHWRFQAMVINMVGVRRKEETPQLN